MTPLCEKIAFGMLRGINVATGRELLRRAGSPGAVFAAGEEALAAILGRPGGIASAAYRSDIARRARAEEAFALGSGVRPLFFTDDDYPRRLLDCDDAPALLYATGTPLPPDTRTVAIVGTRHCTPYGVQFTDRLVRGIAERYGRVAIVSGLAYGIDAAAHRAALREGLPTVAVMANPLNTVYPADHRDLAAQIVARGGMLLSEYPTSAQMHRGFFLARNRIVAGMADATIVVESDIRGGAMSTARLAAAYNRELFAAPGRATDATSRGCLDLLARSEALLARDADDIAAALGWTPAAEGTQHELLLELTPEQQRIVDHIRLHPADTVNDIAVALSTPYPALSAILFELEMSDVVATLPGGRYAVLDR